jgi:predicted PurR-regulated permease PerM
MVRALQQWLETHELPAIIAVLGVVVALSVLMVVGGYLYVTP